VPRQPDFERGWDRYFNDAAFLRYPPRIDRIPSLFVRFHAGQIASSLFQPLRRLSQTESVDAEQRESARVYIRRVSLRRLYVLFACKMRRKIDEGLFNSIRETVLAASNERKIFKGTYSGSVSCIFSLNTTAVRVAEWNQCWYTLLTAARIDQRRPRVQLPSA